MKIISFALTTQAFLDGKKTVTRRDWKDEYAKTWRKGDLFQVYNKNPCCHGSRIGYGKVTAEPYKQWLHEVTDEDEIKEGHLWGSGKSYQMFMGNDRELWVIEFVNLGIEIPKSEDALHGWFEAIKKM